MSTLTPTIVLAVFVAMGVARAQAPTGTIAGTVTDSSGAPLPGAHVAIVNRQTGQTRTITTSGSTWGESQIIKAGLARG